ncbi:MAG: AAA family ATPase [Halarcobacter ebronensis]|uniref:AAA family ATPase n=1 Tax=Halarcobacter ebronensis TaxID=1462615 RepID=UPI003C745CA3
MVYNELDAFLNEKSSKSKFSTTLGISGGYIEFSNTSGKVFSLGLHSILTIFKDIKINISEFSLHTTYVEKSWRDLGSKYFTDAAANALSTVQTKPLFTSLIKINNWANNITEDSDNTITITEEYLTKTIEKIELVIKDFTPKETSKELDKFILKDKNANTFARDVLFYLNKIDNLENLLPYISIPNKHGNVTISYNSKRLTSIFKVSSTELSKEDLSSGGYLRSFDKNIKLDKLGEFVYVSNQWTGGEIESRLFIGDFIEVINELYSDFYCEYNNGEYYFYNKKERENTFKINEETKGSVSFKYKNILLKGVPGTGKSHLIDKIISDKDKLALSKNDHNILRINIHSASSNADLMQGIGISTKNDQIIYKEKQGLILNHIKKAITAPNQPFVIVLEEIQENSLNELIGDLIYLIEDTKRAKLSNIDSKNYENMNDFIENYILKNPKAYYVEIPYLVSTRTKYKKMILPSNLYIFCTSNYREDKKVIEDNLLRRFEVIEIYPAYKEQIGNDFKLQDVSDFLRALNHEIVSHFHKNAEIHPDRFMIGHAIWIDIEYENDFYAALLKVVTEFKDIKELDYENDLKVILSNIEEYPFDINKDELIKENYQKLVEYLQTKCYSDLLLMESNK